jgi:hypothetical protein
VRGEKGEEEEARGEESYWAEGSNQKEEKSKAVEESREAADGPG